ncbi:hypothetical protein [Lentzea roselyniae]
MIRLSAAMITVVALSSPAASAAEATPPQFADGFGLVVTSCTGKHAEEPCVQAGLNHFVGLITGR